MSDWKSVYEVKEDYIAEGAGDMDVYIIWNKISQTCWVPRKPLKCWFYTEAEATKKAKSIYKKDMKALEKSLLSEIKENLSIVKELTTKHGIVIL